MINLSRIFFGMVIGTSIFFLMACNAENIDTTHNNSTNLKTETDAVIEQQATSVSLKDADANRGKLFFLQCKACHTITKDGEHLIGPNLWGIIDSPAGKKSGFQYSNGLQQASFSWDLETLDRYLIKPNDVIPGTTMIFVGIDDPNMRNDVLAYLVEASTNQEE